MADQETPETIAMDEYKKLQRKYDRRTKSAQQLESRVETLGSGIERLESLVEGLAALVSASDDSVKTAAEDLVSRNSGRRQSDTTAAQLTARLNAMLDDADEDWEDEKFASAREVLDEINSTGDLTRASEVERLIKGAIQPERSVQEQIDEAVAKALATRDGARVDTGTTTVRNGPVSRKDLVDPRGGIDAMRASLDKAFEQLGIS